MLKSREENLQSLFNDAQEKLADLSKDSKKYKELIEKLLLEGLLNLHEPSIEALVRANDVDTAKSVTDGAVKKYKELTGRDTKVEVKEGLPKDRYVYLAYSSAGGLIVTAQQGRVRLDNTLEQRLKLLEEQVCGLRESSH